MNNFFTKLNKEEIQPNFQLSFPPNKRVIDITYAELIQGLGNDIFAKFFEILKPVPALEEGIVHPETGLPEGPEEEVGTTRAREILRSKSDPISIPTIDKYRKKPEYDFTGRNIGGKGLPYKVYGRRAMYKVKDLITFRNNPKSFLKNY